MFTWHNLTTNPPTRTGVYLLGHGGMITAQNHFFCAHDTKWFPGTKMGWQKTMDGKDPLWFNPTHWMRVPYPNGMRDN